jgi:hypothetical protein
MRVSRSQAGLQAQSFCERRRRIGKLALLRQDRTEIIPEIGPLGSEIHGPTQLRGGLGLRISLAENAAKYTVGFHVRWSPRRRRARLSFGLRKISLLRENAGEIQLGICKIRPEPKCRLEMTHRGIQFCLLCQDPAQGGLRLGIRGRAANRFFEIGAGGNKVALLERLLSALVGEPRR